MSATCVATEDQHALPRAAHRPISDCPRPDPAAPDRPARRAALRSVLAVAIATAAAPLAVPSAVAQAPETEVFADAQGRALRGYDAVAFHREGRPVPGRSDFVHEWRGARWLFASAENRDRFAADPQRWAPVYGGWCSWAVSRGYVAPTDPGVCRVVDGQLHLNYSRSVHRRWERDIPGHVARADANWDAWRR